MSYNFQDLRAQMEYTLEHIKTELASLRTGKATVQLLDPVVVKIYGSQLKINEVATVTVPDPTLLVISPWDKGVLTDIEKAIASADLNLNPIIDGDIVRVPVPTLTEERRKEMVKTLHQKIEAGRVMLRSVRSDAKKDIETQKGTAGISEDDVKSDLAQLNELTQEFFDILDEVAQAKEQDLLTV